jgi:hypothetical protein
MRIRYASRLRFKGGKNPDYLVRESLTNGVEARLGMARAGRTNNAL